LNKTVKRSIFLIASLVLSIESLWAQVIFTSPALRSNAAAVDSLLDQTSSRIVYFNLTAIKDLHASNKDAVLEADIDSLLFRLADRDIPMATAAGYLADTRPFQLQGIPAIPPVRLQSWQDYRISSRFGWRIHPIGGNTRLHNGLDLPQPIGTPVYATATGKVKWVMWESNGLGLAVCVKHPTGYETVYGHLSTYAVRQGDNIQQGMLIGQVGNTGRTTGPHLHYSILYRGKPVDSERYCFLWMRLAHTGCSRTGQCCTIKQPTKH